MTEKRKQELDRAWNGTRFWEYLDYISREDSERAKDVFLNIKEYKNTPLEIFINAFEYEKRNSSQQNFTKNCQY